MFARRDAGRRKKKNMKFVFGKGTVSVHVADDATVYGSSESSVLLVERGGIIVEGFVAESDGPNCFVSKVSESDLAYLREAWGEPDPGLVERIRTTVAGCRPHQVMAELMCAGFVFEPAPRNSIQRSGLIVLARGPYRRDKAAALTAIFGSGA